jgi:hypothetical protein
MSDSKKININFFQLFSQEADFDQAITAKLLNMREADCKFGFFDVKSGELAFHIHEIIGLAETDTYLISLVKEKLGYPVHFTREGGLDEVPLDAGALGDISYFLLVPDKQVILSFQNGITAPNISMFTSFLRWLTDDKAIGVQPVFVSDVYETVNSWEIFRKLTLGIEAPTADFVDALVTTEAGRELGLLEKLSGLKIDITVSMGHSKGSLERETVKTYIREILTENFAKKLEITGKGFEETSTETFDLYKAKLKFSTEIIIEGTFPKPIEIRSAFFAAYLTNQEAIEELEPIEVTEEA